MELVLDTANIEQIKKYIEYFNISGVTTNPTILSREKSDIKTILCRIKDCIGDRRLHVQVTGTKWQEMVAEANSVIQTLGKDIYIKIPSDLQGFRAMKELVDRGIHVTATVVYSPEQAFMAALAGADYVAIYYNKQYNYNINPAKTTSEIKTMYKANEIKTKIITASFRNTRQVIESFLAGADAATVSANIMELFSINPLVENAVNNFAIDWKTAFGGKTLDKLIV